MRNTLGYLYEQCRKKGRKKAAPHIAARVQLLQKQALLWHGLK